MTVTEDSHSSIYNDALANMTTQTVTATENSCSSECDNWTVTGVSVMTDSYGDSYSSVDESDRYQGQLVPRDRGDMTVITTTNIVI